MEFGWIVPAVLRTADNLRSNKHFTLGIFLAVFILGISFSLQAQGTADVVGTVTDTTGAVVPSATVTLANVGTGVTATTQSSASGDYIFPGVLIGTYTVKVTATGFKTFATAPFTVAVGDRARVDAKMEVGEQTVTVEVSAAAPALHTDTGSLNTLIPSPGVEDVPLDGRNVVKLVWLTAGASQSSSGLASGDGPDDRRQTSAFSVNGVNPFANNNMLDGMDNNEVIVGASAVRPSVDAIQEISVSTNDYDAQYTKTGGGNVNIVTKSGTNHFHGSVYEFFRNAALNANPSYSFPSSVCAAGDPSGCQAGSVLYSGAAANPPFRQNQYGASLGGPIKKDKTFFFGDFEQYRLALGQAQVNSVPTDCNRGLAACPDGKTQFGDFSDMPLISNPGGGFNPCVQDGTPACPYVDVASNQINPMGLAYFSMYPRANRPGTTSNYFSDPTKTQNSTTFDGRIDQHFSDKDQFYGRYSYNDIETLIPDAFPTVTLTSAQDPLITSGSVTVHPGAAQSVSLPGPNHTREQGVALSEVHVFSPTLVLKLTAGYQRSYIHSLTLNGNTTNLAEKLGFPCNSQSCINTSNTDTNGIPVVSMNGLFGPPPFPGQYTQIGDAVFVPILHNSNTFEYSGILTWTKGSQSIKMGAVLIRRRNTFSQSNNGRADFFFTGGYTGVPAADMLEGLSSGGAPGFQLRSLVVVAPQLRSWEPGAFIQDDWRAKKWLTLNLGIRYDIFTPFTEKTGQLANWDPSNGLMVSPALPGLNHSSNTAGIRTNYRDIAPRFGFAASLGHGAVVRGGFGLSFYVDNIGASASMINPPFEYSYNCQVQSEIGTNNACQNPFANNATVNYGQPTSNSSSSVGQQGGLLLSAGAPVPVVNVDQVLLPASCPVGANPFSFGCTAQGGNQYANIVPNTAFLPNFPSNYLEVYNLAVEKDFSGNVVSLGYVGNLGRHLRNSPYDPTNISNEDQTTNPLTADYPWTQNFENNGFAIQEKWGSSSYQSLQSTYTRRFKNGLTVNANYTWSHSIWDGQGVCQPTISFALLGYGNGKKYMNPCYYDNLQGTARVLEQNTGYYNTANSPQDVRHRIAWEVNYDLPFGSSAKGIESLLVKGWSVNSAGYWQTGLPFTVGNGVGSTNVGPSGNPDAVCSGVGNHSELFGWVNPDCFKLPQPGDFGNLKVNSLFGPHQRNLDFSVFKNFTPREWLTTQFRVEVFNLFNTPNFGNPSVGFGCYGATCINNPGDKAQLANPNDPAALPQGVITSLAPASTNNAREVQFAVKLLF